MSESTKPEKQTLIEEGTEFQGTVKSTCPVVVNGCIKGELSAPKLEITATGSVEGSVKADHLSSRGRLSGNIDAGNLILSGSVGEKTVIKARNLEVKLAPERGRMELTFGECTLDVGEEPTKERREDTSASAERSSGAPAAKDETSISGDAKSAGDKFAGDKSAGDESAAGKSDDANDKALATGLAGFGISRPPPAGGKKNGASDSIPPGP